MRDVLAERLQGVRDTDYLLYQKTKEKLGYEYTLKDTTQNEQKELREQQQYDDEQYDTVPKIKFVY